MGTDLNRDGQLDGLLRNAVRAETPVGPCLDAERIAAWIDGGLPNDEALAVEQHMSTCSTCRQIASLAATTGDAEETGGTGPRSTEESPSAAPVVVPFVPRVARWKVAVTAAGAVAATVLIWVAVRQPESTPTLESTAAVSRQSAPQPLSPGLSQAAEAPSAEARRAEATTPRPEAKAQQGQGGQARDAAANAQAAEKPRPFTRSEPSPTTPAPLTPTPLPGQQASTRTAPPPPAVMPPPPAAVPPPPPPAFLPPPVRPQTTAVPPVLTQTAVSSATDSSRLSETITTPPVIAEFVAGADAREQQAAQFRTAAGGGGGGRGGGGAAAGGVAARQAPVADAAVAVPVRWRLRGSLPAANVPSRNVLERSTDNGRTWQDVKIDPATPQLAAGAAPTNIVCWLAGRAGTVLVSEDGTNFRAVSKPTSDDLVSIQATDARTATVRTADGRTFGTSDGGGTWVPRK